MNLFIKLHRSQWAQHLPWLFHFKLQTARHHRRPYYGPNTGSQWVHLTFPLILLCIFNGNLKKYDNFALRLYRFETGLCVRPSCYFIQEKPGDVSISFQHVGWKFWVFSQKWRQAWVTIREFFTFPATNVANQTGVPKSKNAQTSSTSHPIQAA